MSEKSNDCLWIHKLLCELKEVSTDSDRTALIERFRREHSGDMENAVIDDADTLAEMLITLKRSGTDHKLANLSEDELAELQETERIIDENLFDYYFQPIVSAKDGEIFSYEALMRPKSDMKLTPYHILKYASLVNRLPDIERGTFLNVLGIIDVRKDDFFGKSVFINSIPEAKMSTEDFRKVTKMLLKHSDMAVVEMTEQSEIDDESLESLKERYHNMGVKMAIDDYGSGYSNAGNLLRYMPNFVKIDRSLLTDIQNSPKKRHFVREIIHFCHENEILALAEGVETAEELHTVILLGADLIQGYFTARPAPEIIDSIPDEIKQMIKRYHQEREDGIGQQIYIADVSERIILERLMQSGMKCIVIGSNGSGDISIEGSSELDSQIRIETRKGYSGRITLENAWLNSIKNKPCIDIGEDNEVTLVLCGDNKLDMGGIRVPKSSKLTIAGEGRLEINVNGKEFYGIGNGAGLWHGDITFEQSGRITVNADGEKGVAIGSGNGGVININAGQYRLNVQGDVNVGIGALYAESDMVIHDCDIGMEMNSARGTAIGSIGKSDFITIFKTSIKVFMTGTELVGIGTLDGEKTEFAIREASCFITINGERCSALAALEGCTNTSLDRVAVGITVSGRQALGIGGFTKDTTIHHNEAEVHIKVDTDINILDYMDRDRMMIDKTLFDIVYNGEKLVFENDG
ncbi:EAL domain-containing protein [Ruminococcus flavefaciens]|uniref:EAL domain, c-di-GMP-specific phosphodiesterase class I (Or its enzymatically inactive variant) n=1 Tax=Ruminococcus flavefaciens TaxID=1265 RepID=A0A1K1PRF4_RUMFL|nr:EAL domain-containing protein [Ruminococcus flavefaciens]SFW50076.1 EAL domain, c-di-GMP-specific phosphodiesterase class I (or its enzymatically inactive variant) [Ruminococcus flavefaciens]